MKHWTGEPSWTTAALQLNISEDFKPPQIKKFSINYTLYICNKKIASWPLTGWLKAKTIYGTACLETTQKHALMTNPVCSSKWYVNWKVHFHWICGYHVHFINSVDTVEKTFQEKHVDSCWNVEKSTSFFCNLSWFKMSTSKCNHMCHWCDTSSRRHILLYIHMYAFHAPLVMCFDHWLLRHEFLFIPNMIITNYLHLLFTEKVKRQNENNKDLNTLQTDKKLKSGTIKSTLPL